MKIFLLICFSLLLGFVSHDVFAETEMTGSLQILVSHGPGDNPQPYSFWFMPDDQATSYKLNPSTLPQNILDWAEERVRVTVDEVRSSSFETSLNQNEQFLHITSIEVISQPEEILFSHTPPPVRSVTLLSKFLDEPATPSEDPNRSPGQFKAPNDVAVDDSGNIYTIEWGQNTGEGHRIQKFDSSGNFLFKFGKGGTGGSGDFFGPSGIEVDSSGNIYVVESWGNRVQKFDSDGVFLLEFGAAGSGDSEFNNPFGIAVDSSDNVYVADTFNHRIQKFNSTGVFQGWLGGCTAGDNCLAGPVSDGFLCTAATCGLSVFSVANGGFNSPRGIVIDSTNKIYIVQSANDRIQKFDSNGGFLTGLNPFTSSGTAEGQFSDPHGIAVDTTHVYVSDAGSHRIQKFDHSLAFVSMWGWGVQNGTAALQTCMSGCQIGLAGSGVGQLDSPEGIASGSIYVADAKNDRIKKFSTSGGYVSELGAVPDLIHNSTYYQDLFYDSAGSLKNYYNVSSYGHFILNGTADDWKTLPSNKAVYVIDPNLMVTHAMNVHEGTVDFCNPTPVTNLLLVFNGDVIPGGGGAFGTLGTPATLRPTDDDCDNITASVSWLPDYGGGFCCGQDDERGLGTPAHEVGHNIGLRHTPPPPGDWVATGPYNDPYHDPNSLMSTNADREGPAPLIMAQRDKVGWVDSGNKVEVASGASATITLDFSNEPQGGVNPQMITVPLSDGTSYIIEGQKEGLFSDTPQDKTGVLIYKKIPGGNDYSYLTFDPNDKLAEYSLVATAGTDTLSDFDEASLEVGETYEDVVNSVNVTALSTGNSITVFVSNNATSTCTPPSGENWVISESCTLTGDVTADMNITIQDDSVLTIPDGLTVFFDPTTFSITVISGSGILVEQGGSIQTSP